MLIRVIRGQKKIRMKKLHRLTKTLAVVTFLAFQTSLPAQKKIKILIITGGHSFEYKPFYNFFSSLSNISYDTLRHPAVNPLIASRGVDKYDALVFYDMGDSIEPSHQQAYIDLLNQGKSMIFLHHSLVSYQRWPEFIKIVGGQYHTNRVVVNGDTLSANYEHDVNIPVKVEDRNHPITRGINDFEIFDEIYGDVEILPTVKPLLSSNHPKSMKYLAWVNPYGKSDVLYIQLGHGPTGFSNPNFKRLVQQGIEWSVLQHSRSK